MSHNYLSSFWIALTSIFLVFPSLSFASEVPEWQSEADRLMAEDLVVYFSSDSGNTLNLTQVDDGALFFRIGSGDVLGSMPLESIGPVQIIADTPKGFERILMEVGRSTWNVDALNTLRAEAYPMLRFLSLPTEKCNFQYVVLKFFEGLVQLNQFPEAIYLLKHLELASLGPYYQEKSIELLLNLVDANNYPAFNQAVSLIPLEIIDASNLKKVLSIADRLRNEDRYAMVTPIYERLADNEQVESLEPQMWQYYCQIYSGELADQPDFIDVMLRVPSTDPLYALQQLIIGSYYLQTERLALAMEAIAEGLAYATPMDAWMPELMYRSAQLYAALDKPEVAQSMFKEMQLFFPQSHWAQKPKL